ncbi:hypothetical protein O59_000424 [Cellvibrio sp. BR]|nr:hypothetical protein O59_000424 [Cellvibrio sp. BR]
MFQSQPQPLVIVRCCLTNKMLWSNKPIAYIFKALPKRLEQ